MNPKPIYYKKKFAYRNECPEKIEKKKKKTILISEGFLILIYFFYAGLFPAKKFEPLPLPQETKVNLQTGLIHLNLYCLFSLNMIQLGRRETTFLKI